MPLPGLGGIDTGGGGFAPNSTATAKSNATFGGLNLGVQDTSSKIATYGGIALIIVAAAYALKAFKGGG